MKQEKLGLIGPLRQLAHEYHHIKNEHAREAPNSATRRHVEADMRRIAARFERLLTHWLDDEELRGAWVRCFYENEPAPDEPQIAVPPLFRGVNEPGSVVEIHATADNGYDVVVDGTVVLHEHVPWHLDPDQIEPIRIGEHDCWERFSSPDEAVRALATFVGKSGSEPPWQWARVLFEDGLIGLDFELTPRGRRRLRPIQPAAARGRVKFCVLVADAARARVFTLESADEAQATVNPLVEVAQATNPERRARDSETFSETRPGVRRAGPAQQGHGTDDHRERHRHEADRHFAEAAVAEAARVWNGDYAKRVIVVASPSILGLLRPFLAREQRRHKQLAVRELTRDMTKLAPAALHDALAEAGLLPRRKHVPLASPPPGAPIVK